MLIDRINLHRWKLFFLIFPLLAGCATLDTTSTVVRTITVDPVVDVENVVAADFDLLGRVSVRNDQQRFSGSVHWQHTQQEDTILLLSPLGQAVAEIKKNDAWVSLVTAKQEAFHAKDVEDLTAEILGWRLPLQGLQYWIQGQYSPISMASVDLDINNRIVALRQDGWQILFTRYYTDLPEQGVRPRIIELRFEDLNIRMVVDNWIEI